VVTVLLFFLPQVKRVPGQEGPRVETVLFSLFPQVKSFRREGPRVEQFLDKRVRVVGGFWSDNSSHLSLSPPEVKSARRQVI
jgi:hypothetical protein